jgi:endonuclease-3
MKYDFEPIFRILEMEYKKLPTPSVTTIARINKDPFLVLISTIISLRTKDNVTIEASTRLFEEASAPEDMIRLGHRRISELIYPAGFYRKKGETIYHISKILLENYNGKVPSDMDSLLKIKGVGRKTANLLLVEGFGIPAVCVDIHVHRIMNRMGIVSTKTPDETENVLRRLLPVEYWIKWNEYLVSFGQHICRPVSPFCSSCNLTQFCAKEKVTARR